MTEISLETIQKAHQGGKLETISRKPVTSRQELSIIYTPGVGKIVEAIRDNPEMTRTYTTAGNTVGVITNGTAVLGYGDTGVAASLPVMEGKCVIFKELAGINAYPLAIDEKNPDKLVAIITSLAHNFAALNLEDIAAPDCFYIEAELQKYLNIPVIHDDQHGTAIVASAALLNALTLFPKQGPRIVIVGAGAAGTAITNLLAALHKDIRFESIKVVDSHGIVSSDRQDLVPHKQALAELTKQTVTGSMAEAIKESDVCIGVSQGGLLTPDLVKTMRPDPIIFAMANPTPEIMPEVAYTAGAAVVGTGRSDLPNQINNALAYPGVFKGLLASGAKQASTEVKIAAVQAIVQYHKSVLSKDQLLPDIMDKKVPEIISEAIVSLH